MATGLLGEVYVDGKIKAADLLNFSTPKRSMAGHLLIRYIYIYIYIYIYKYIDNCRAVIPRSKHNVFDRITDSEEGSADVFLQIDKFGFVAVSSTCYQDAVVSLSALH